LQCLVGRHIKQHKKKITEDLGKSNTTAALWADHKWNTERQKNISRLHTFTPSLGQSSPEMT